MKTAFDHDGGGFLDAALVAVQAGDLDRGLVGLGAGVGEEHALHARQLAQPIGETLLQRYSVQVGGVNQRRRLFAHGLGNPGMGVAEPAHCDARERVQIALAVNVGQVGA